MDKRHALMEGITTGIPRGHTKPQIDGIYQGIPETETKNNSVKSSINSVKPSATQFSVGVFGAGRSIEGKGNGSASSAGPKRRARE